jgi:hypothetical protein
MEYCFKTLKTSVLMYPEACYSFDGTATTLPRKMGILLKKYDVPVLMIETSGLFNRNPLYNELKIREAKKLIRQGQYNISQISDLLGFDSPQYFSRCFKNAVHMTPREYMESIRE